MKVQHKHIKAIADKTGYSFDQVKGVVDAQIILLRTTIQKQEPKSVYLRNVGYFTSPQVREKFYAQRLETRKIKKENNNDEADGPYEFE